MISELELPEEACGLHVEIQDSVATCTLSRPPGNRVSLALMQRMLSVFRALAEAQDVRVVWLTHEGDDFCHGADLMDPELARSMASGPSSRKELAELGEALISSWRQLPMPTVASAQGRIIGAGACLFVTADFRLAPEDAEISFPEVDRGMHLSWGIIPELVHVLGLDGARRLALLGEPQRVADCPPGFATAAGDETPRAWVDRLAKKAPLALRSIKAALGEVRDGMVDVAARDPERFAATTGSDDFQEAMRAFLEKRDPKFSGR